MSDVTVTLTVEEANVVLAVLSDINMPHRISEPLINKIATQAKEQLAKNTEPPSE